jgi:hypothetical protein
MNLVMIHTARQRASLLDRPWFFPVAVALLLLGHACDVLGTYLAQPNLEQEANHLYMWAAESGYRPGWPEVIFLKLLFCGLAALGFRAFLWQRHRFYPPIGANFREFITTVYFGRPVSWLETLYLFPKDWSILPLTVSAILVLVSPHSFYMGYVNLAHHLRLWRPTDGFFWGERWIDLSVVPCAFFAFGLLFWLLWRDYRAPFES